MRQHPPTRTTEAPPAPRRMPPRLITTEDVAAWLGFTTDEIKRMRSRGRGPAYVKLGTKVRYDPRDVQAFIDSNRKTHDPAQDVTP